MAAAILLISQSAGVLANHSGAKANPGKLASRSSDVRRISIFALSQSSFALWCGRFLRQKGQLLFVPALSLREPSDNLEQSSIRPSLNLMLGLVLYGMRDVHRIKIWAVERRGLGPRSRLELPSGDGYGRHSQIL